MKMNEFKGYPAPWDMRIKDGMAIFDFNHEGEIPHYRFAECVVSLATDDEPQDYLMANANLIAAAPELLEALQLLMAEQTGGNKSCGHNGFTCMCPYDKARAAIAKALGESR